MATDEPSGAQQRGRRGPTLVLAVIFGVVLILGIIVGRFGLSALQPTSEGAAGVAQVPTATNLPTATPLDGVAPSGGVGTVVAAATPYATPIIPGYARPDQDNATQQQLRDQLGNADKVIIVSLDGQYIQAWEKGKLVKWSYVTTGKPESPTPTGFFKVGYKLSPYTFSSAAPKNSAGYYYPTKGIYALFFADGGYFIHDAWWRTVYGPGLTTWHMDPSRNEWQTGSHGCVNTPIEMMGWLYVWADVGTDVIIY